MVSRPTAGFEPPSWEMRDFDAIGVAREGDRQVRMLGREMFEGFLASRDDGGLQLRRGACFEA